MRDDDLMWLRRLCLPDSGVITHSEVCERVDRIIDVHDDLLAACKAVIAEREAIDAIYAKEFPEYLPFNTAVLDQLRAAVSKAEPEGAK